MPVGDRILWPVYLSVSLSPTPFNILNGLLCGIYDVYGEI